MLSLTIIKDYFNQPLIDLHEEKQNADYEGHTFSMNHQTYRSRLGKKTPKKNGYFVAFWEKNPANQNQAFDFEASPENLLIVIKDENNIGFFNFPKSVLEQKKILRTKTQPGKMAIRLYPIWETDLNPTAQKTQNWQVPYFTNLSKETTHL